MEEPFITMVVTSQTERRSYLLNNELAPHVLDKMVEDILKHWPKDALVDFID